MPTFITRLEPPPGSGPRVAVKDCIDVAGVVTTVGSPAVASAATPAVRDAACVAAVRGAGGRIVGKANLHELCFGSTGVNPWYGTPANPLDPSRIPGGSSSGSAVAVATGEADFALGTDTTGSVRTPAACCGVAGLKTTWGRVSLDGVAPLAPSLDTVGVLAVGVAALTTGMAMVDPTFDAAAAGSADNGEVRVGRIRPPRVEPGVDQAIDAALAAAGCTMVDIELAGWGMASDDGLTVLFAEAWRAWGHLYQEPAAELGDELRERFAVAQQVTSAQEAAALARRSAWQRELDAALSDVDAISLPVIAGEPPRIEARDIAPNHFAAAVSFAGNPALALPVPRSDGRLPASVQLVGARGGDEDLVRVGARIERAVGAGPHHRAGG
ncbi:MAG TPA: amidase [Acidimicrobiales bacterium]|jgi:amidase|nr:amidase [Acidimicrobiales bacterium]